MFKAQFKTDTSVDLDHDGEVIACATGTGKLKIFDMEGNQKYTIDEARNRIYRVSVWGEHIVGGSLNGSIKVWDKNTGVFIKQLSPANNESILELACYNELVYVSREVDIDEDEDAESKVYVYSIPLGTVVKEFDSGLSNIQTMEVSEKHIALSDISGDIGLFDRNTYDIVQLREPNRLDVNAVSITPTHLVTVGYANTPEPSHRVNMWLLETLKLEHDAVAHDKIMMAVGSIRDLVVTGGDDEKVKLWSASSGNIIKVIPSTHGGIDAMVVQDDMIVFITYSGHVSVWKPEGAEETDNLVIAIFEELKNPLIDLPVISYKNVARYTEFELVPTDLRTHVVNALHEEDPNEPEYECPILSSPIKNDTMVAILACNHVMSKAGYEGWKNSGKNSCPMCRATQGQLKTLSKRQIIIEKILIRWEKDLNDTRDEFFKQCSVNTTVVDLLKYAKDNKDKIVFQSHPDEKKAELASKTALEWFMQLKLEDSNKRPRGTSAKPSDIPPLIIKRPINY